MNRYASLSLLSALLICGPTWTQAASNLLQNPGFEESETPGQATGWWYSNDAGRVTWAALSGEAGNAFFPAGTTYGAFGQDVPIDMRNGQVLEFRIHAKAESNYINTNTAIQLAFFSDEVDRYHSVTYVYDQLHANRGNWMEISVTHTALLTDVNKIVVMCYFADGTVAAGQSEATCQWDDGVLTQSSTPPASPPLGKFEPIEGVYLGVLLDQGGTMEEVEAFNDSAGKTHAVYAKFVILQTDPFPWEWINTIHSNYPSAGIHLTLEPMIGFSNFYTEAAWQPGNETYDAAYSFVTNCAAVQTPIFLRFAHEANGNWYPWHPEYSTKYGITDTVTPETYIRAWQNFAEMVHTHAPNVAMVWAPNQGVGDDPLPYYGRVYPGDESVDWVGLSVYNGSTYGNSDEVWDYQFRDAIQRGYWQDNDLTTDDTFENFYWEFSDPDNPCGHKKPMMIAETSAMFIPEYLLDSEVLIAGFESLSGPNFTSDETLAAFQNLNSDGWSSTNHTWIDGFEDISIWNGGPWGTNGYAWSNSTDCVEGTNALLITGAPENNPEGPSVYLGGNLRPIDSLPHEPIKVIAEFQDLNSDGLQTISTTPLEMFEDNSVWWPPWSNLQLNVSSDCIQGTNALRMTGLPYTGANNVGGTGRHEYSITNWSSYDGMQLWIKRDTTCARDIPPELSIRIRSIDPNSDTYYADQYIPWIDEAEYTLVRIPFENMALSPDGQDWQRVTSMILSFNSATTEAQPDDLLIDNFCLAEFDAAPTTDQSWDTPWGATGGAFSWKLTNDPAPNLSCPDLSLLMSSEDNTNSYLGGNSFSTRTADRDWSGGSHLAL
ncbi:MAG: glycosyl hydrolase, partial [Kiritimatiellae bacterium]|nr:glycosyl hydrolase [Kiritimatiellia bacterium]